MSIGTDTGSGLMTSARASGGSRCAVALVLAGSAALLSGALGFQFLGGLPPCPLCVWQRVPHAVVIVLMLAALWRLPPRPALALAGVALLVGTGLAAYHVGVEQGLIGSACDGGLGATTIEDLRAQLAAQTGPACSQVAWSFLGISMAGWNGLISLALAAFALAAAVRPGRRAG